MSAMGWERGDFYEDDEPMERVVQAFERGQKIKTAPRASRGQNVTVRVGEWTGEAWLIARRNEAVGQPPVRQ